MKVVVKRFGAVMLVVLVAAGLSNQAKAAEPAGGPLTIWKFLGIPQATKKIRDNWINRRGNRPKWEKKPPLKPIADPANLESPNPAIKAAAKIKAEEDLAKQKIKAIKYLATVGCGCYPGVREALLAALDDCTEQVRYEAAIAFCEAAGNHCDFCESSGCCNAEVMTKLQELAEGKDAKGCPKEASSRVRAAARNALNACRRMLPPSPERLEPIPEPKEVPVETTPESELSEPVPEALQRKQWPMPTPAPPRPPQEKVSLIIDPMK